MLSYFGSKISDNIAVSPEGFLVCKNVPIGRAGWMKYKSTELPALKMDAEFIDVYRDPEEIFSQKTMASFEGKPFTDEHPKDFVNVDNVSYLSKGHIQNVRRKDNDMIADIIVTDKKLIKDVENGKREVSSGYECFWDVTDFEKSKVEQSKIIGNHVALVAKGRAGDRIAIKDSAPIINNERGKLMLKNIKKGTAAFFGLRQIAKDGTPEQFEEALKAEIGDAEPEVKEEEKKPVADMEIPEESGEVKSLTEKVEALTSMVEALVKTDEKVHEEIGADMIFEEMEKGESADTETVEEEKAEDMGNMESEIIEDMDPEEVAKKMIGDSAMFIAAKEAIMSISDEKVRNKAAKTFREKAMDAFPKADPDGGYGSIVKNQRAQKKQIGDKSVDSVGRMKNSTDAWNAAGQNLKGVK